MAEATRQIMIVVRDDQVIVMQKPSSYAAATLSMGRGLYSGKYLRKERKSWD